MITGRNVVSALVMTLVVGVVVVSLGSYGTSQYFWWLLLLFAVLVPMVIGLRRLGPWTRRSKPIPEVAPATYTPDGRTWHPEAPIPPTYYSFHAAPIDWEGFVQSMAIRIEEALGPGFYAHGYEFSLLLSHADSTRRIQLSGMLRSTPLDPTAMAMHACIKVLDEAQMFKMQQLRQRWPKRPLQDDSSPPTTLARPTVKLEDFEFHMAFVDELGPVLDLLSLPWVEGHPEPDGPVRLA